MKTIIYKEYFAKLFWIFNKSKTYVALLFVAFLFLAALDLVGISLVGPLVLIFFDFEKVQTEYGWFVGYDQKNLAVLATSIIVIIFSLRTVCIWALNSLILNAAFDRQVELRAEIIEQVLHQDYSKRLTKSTAHYTTVLFSYCQAFVQAVINVLRIGAEGLSIFFIMLLLIFTNFQLFLVALIFSGAAISGMILLFSKNFIAYGEDKNKGLVKFSNAVHESVFGIKEIKVLGLTDFFRARVIDGASRAAAAEKKLYLFSIVPRYIVETILVAIICLILVISIFANEDVLEVVGVLSIFLVASMRLLPSISLVIAATNDLSLGFDSISKLFDELQGRAKLTHEANIVPSEVSTESFQKLEFQNVSFSYVGSTEDEIEIFNNLNVSIHAGDFIGLVGESGAGKTTLIDLILGINTPQSGIILRNEHPMLENLNSWRSEIAYLPQETFILSGTIAENVAVGSEVADIDMAKVNKAVTKAGLNDLIGSLPDGLLTEVGERGLKFSGGQRQRIALARAFFAGRNIFLFDESTSALDSLAAESILEELGRLHKEGSTVILISHNQEMLWRCSRRLKIINGMVTEVE